MSRKLRENFISRNELGISRLRSHSGPVVHNLGSSEPLDSFSGGIPWREIPDSPFVGCGRTPWSIDMMTLDAAERPSISSQMLLQQSSVNRSLAHFVHNLNPNIESL